MNKLFVNFKRFIINNTRIIDIFYSIPFYLFRCFKIDNNKIIVVSFNGKGYGDNGKCIIDYLISDKKCSNYKIYWAVKDNKYIDSLPKIVLPVKIGSLKYIYHLVTSKVWVNNSRFPVYVKKRKKQFYIQTWHSSLRLKKIEMDVEQNLSKNYVRAIKNDSKMIDLMIAGSQFSYESYRRAFLYNGKIEKIGTPRCDLFFNKKICETKKDYVFKKYHLDSSKKTILYAPTFRDYTNDDNWMINFDDLFSYLGDDYNILIRLHPNMKRSTINSSKKVIDVTSYPDMQDLLCAVDMLVTDYSGCSFDMLIAHKPCILYLQDLDLYLSKERDLYFDILSLPFPISYTIEQLAQNIQNFKCKEYETKRSAFFNQIGLYENGNASKALCDIIKEVISNEKI